MTNKELLKKIFIEGFFDENDFQKQGPKTIPEVVLLYSSLDGVNLCWCEEGSNFSVNPFRVDAEGNIYVSGLSIGGTVKARGVPLEKAVLDYNKSHAYTNGGLFSQLAIITREQWLERHQ